MIIFKYSTLILYCKKISGRETSGTICDPDCVSGTRIIDRTLHPILPELPQTNHT